MRSIASRFARRSLNLFQSIGAHADVCPATRTRDALGELIFANWECVRGLPVRSSWAGSMGRAGQRDSRPFLPPSAKDRPSTPGRALESRK